MARRKHEEFVIDNPQESQWWMSRLYWLMENDPQTLLEMWNSPNHEKLLHHLDVNAGHAIRLEVMFNNQPPDVRMELIAEAICPPPQDFPDETLPEEIEMEILAWTRTLPDDREIVIS